MFRRYIEESDVGNLFADAFAEMTGSDIGMIHSGSLRKDLPGGEIRLVDLLDTYPFVDDVIVKRLNGKQLRAVFEQSFTLERGLMQISGLQTAYDLSLPEGSRLVALTRNGVPVADTDTFSVAVPGFVAEGGDLYTVFADLPEISRGDTVTALMQAYFAKREVIAIPARGRQLEIRP